jgi:hypothetical protein
MRQRAFGASLGYLWQVFVRLLPKLIRLVRVAVFDSNTGKQGGLLGSDISRYGSVRSIVKTTDGRYAINASATTFPSDSAHAFNLVLVLATGYPGWRLSSRFTSIMRRKLQISKRGKMLMNQRSSVFTNIWKQFYGTVMIWGRIVVSNCTQRG